MQGGLERINEAAKQGFEQAIVPKGNMPSSNNKSKQLQAMKLRAISHLSELMDFVRQEF